MASMPLPSDLVGACLARVPSWLSGKVALVSRSSRDAVLAALGGAQPVVRLGPSSSSDELLWATACVDWDGWGAWTASAGFAAAGDVDCLRSAWKASGGRLDLDTVRIVAAERGLVRVLAWADFASNLRGWEASSPDSPDDLFVRHLREAAARGGRDDVVAWVDARYA